MRLIYLNPNSTVSMTEQVVATARESLPQAEILGWTNSAGPPAIQGAEDGARALGGLRAMLPALEAARPDAVIVACFDDVGLSELRAALSCPVLGIGQAAYQMAALASGSFSVVTTTPASVPVLAENLARYGLSGACRSIRASGLPVLEVEKGGAAVLDRLSAEIAAAAGEGSRVVTLGCAGMAGLRAELAARCDVLLIEGVSAAACLARAVIDYRRLARGPVPG